MSSPEQKQKIREKLKQIITLISNGDNKSLSNIQNVEKFLPVIYEKQDFKRIIDTNLYKFNVKNLNGLINKINTTNKLQPIINKEDEKLLNELSDENILKELNELQDTSVDTADINIKMDSLFETKLKEMEAKLPLKLGELDSSTEYPKYIQDKEFCYKFLYCWMNYTDNQTNEDAKAVYNIIIDAYDIQNIKKQVTNSIALDSNITFDVGFIINIEPTKRGGSTIPTQKRRPNKPKKRNHTIKDRVRVKTR